ncbi:methyltransferase domain-containing protein [Tumebacillus sp. DT12]|uniref:Methyltransferase domain-containing protein n=1 Tax=Tumebacillus lacus TaxID=2995335 RepID=A0ABT3WXG6_9BACL|nr:methyltransferase domain-containing protein [Tumebacillus lacus]MCX7569355.1 methyltransferase domain-containing protein [Tumebacillus lacus]
MKNRTNRAKYKYLSLLYDLLMGNRMFLIARKRGINLLQIQPDERLLLVGVGTGADLPLLPADAHVTGVDLSPEMLAKAAAKANGPRVQLMEMNAEKLEFPDQHFDTVVLSLILSVVETPSQAMKEALRVVKEGGSILVFDKFLHDSVSPSLGRRLLNRITSFIGTDINRRFEEIVAGLPVQVVHEESSLFKGSYRIIVLQKEEGPK